jgi:hypothetical protein
VNLGVDNVNDVLFYALSVEHEDDAFNGEATLDKNGTTSLIAKLKTKGKPSIQNNGENLKFYEDFTRNEGD